MECITALAPDDDHSVLVGVSRECPTHLGLALAASECDHEHTSLGHELGALDIILCEVVEGLLLLTLLRGLSGLIGI